MHRFPPLRLLIVGLLILGSLTTSLLPVSAQDTPGMSPATPVPVGSAGQIGDYSLTVTNVMPDAAEYVMAYSEFNTEPEPGMQFFLTRVQVSYTGTASGSPWLDLGFSASTGSDDDEPYTDWGYSCGDIPDSASSRSNELFPGGTLEFNLCWLIDEADAGSLVMQVSPNTLFTDNGVVWFSLGNAPMATPEPGGGLKTTNVAVPSSRTEPIPLGTANLVGTYTVQVVSVEPDATDMVVTDDSFNEPPAEGNQFYLVTISVTNQGDIPSSPWWDLTFNAVGDQSIGYTETTNSCGYVPNGSYEAPELAPGESAEFNVCWQVPTAEAASLVMYVDAGFGGERAWFAIQP